MPRRVKFVGRDVTDPERPMLVYEAEGGVNYRVPEERLRTPEGAAAAAAYVGGYPDPGTERGPQFDTSATFVGYDKGSGQPVFANNYTRAARPVPGGMDQMMAPRHSGGENARVILGPPSPEQTSMYNTYAAGKPDDRIQGVPDIAADMQRRAARAAQDRNTPTMPDQYDIELGPAEVRPLPPPRLAVQYASSGTDPYSGMPRHSYESPDREFHYVGSASDARKAAQQRGLTVLEGPPAPPPEPPINPEAADRRHLADIDLRPDDRSHMAALARLRAQLGLR